MMLDGATIFSARLGIKLSPGCWEAAARSRRITRPTQGAMFLVRAGRRRSFTRAALIGHASGFLGA